MKHSTALLCALFSILTTSPALSQVNVGPIMGVNRAQYRAPEDVATFAARTRYAIGGVVDVALGDVVGVRAEPMFIQKGGAALDSPLHGDVTLNAAMIEVPLFLTVGFGEGTRPYLLAGPALGALLTSSLKLPVEGREYEADLADVTKRFELGVGIGAGVTHDFGRFDGFVESRYLWGLTDMAKSGEVTLYSETGSAGGTIPFDEHTQRYRFRGLQVLVGLTVPMGSGK